MNIMLFGPPGVGKSTLIGALKTEGFRAIDLEDVYPSRIRFQLPSDVDNAFLGAADLNPDRKYHNAVKVLLSLDQDAYERRRSRRDQEVPGKSAQRHQTMDSWMKKKNMFDHVIDNSSVSATILALKKLAKLYFKEVN